MLRFDLAIFRITQIRISSGLTARELSLLINKNPGYISSIECGRITPSIHTIFEICFVLNINVSSIFDLNTNISPNFIKITEEMTDLNEEDLILLYKLVIKIKNGRKS